MKLEDFADDGFYKWTDGCHYEDAESLIQCGMLGMCGCGSPNDNLDYILTGLELIEARRGSPNYGKDRDACNAWWQEHQAKEDAHFKSPEAKYFFWYWLDKERFTSHGGSVPGWLDDKGKELLEMLREWKAMGIEYGAQVAVTLGGGASDE